MEEMFKYFATVIGVITPMLSVLKSLGFLDMKNSRIQRIEKLSSLCGTLEGESRENILTIIKKESEILKDRSMRNFDFGGLFAIMVLSSIMGLATYGVIVWLSSVNVVDLGSWLLKIGIWVLAILVIVVDFAIVAIGYDAILKKEGGIKK